MFSVPMFVSSDIFYFFIIFYSKCLFYIYGNVMIYDAVVVFFLSQTMFTVCENLLRNKPISDTDS